MIGLRPSETSCSIAIGGQCTQTSDCGIDKGIQCIEVRRFFPFSFIACNNFYSYSSIDVLPSLYSL